MTQQVSIRQQIITNLCDKLPDGDQVTDVRRSLVSAIGATQLPVCAVFPISESVALDYNEAGRKRQLTLRIVYVAGRESLDESAPLDELIDSAVVWIEQKVSEDSTMGGLSLDSQVAQITWIVEPGEEEFVGAVVDAVITYFSTGDPSATD